MKFILIFRDTDYQFQKNFLPHVIPISTIKTMSISVNDSNYTSVFLKLLVMLMVDLKEVLQKLNHKFVNKVF